MSGHTAEEVRELVAELRVAALRPTSFSPDSRSEYPAHRAIQESRPEARAALVLSDLLAERERMREALAGLLPVVEEFHGFCQRQDRPCGDYDRECPISMGEWVTLADEDAVKAARSALNPSEAA